MSGPHALSKGVCQEIHRARGLPYAHALRDVGERVDRFSLREARKGAGLNQVKVAHALGVLPSTVSGFESGRCESQMFAKRYSAWALESMPIDVEGPGNGSWHL